MKRVALAAALTLFTAVSLPVPAFAGASSGAAAPVQAQAAYAKNCVPSREAAQGARAPSSAPPIRVCVGDSDTHLNLPWFVTDILTAVDTHQSPDGLLHKMRNDF
ncbi:hypothetical protein CFB89_17185 [Burkholderia sp. AU16741]|uniref:hypothetical protein n=1 Tax=Burkholderia sp. AU16741 TaxID=2015347 RepID=UPI000B7A9B7A|nr:hypothetical protein [Burkholderia sp. AU16741]OXI31216.1 hypothetical protein CFB89_17185 [Burkholderia sp. AU16741]